MDRKFVDAMVAGLKSLREEGLVEPMGLSLTPHSGTFGWQFFKYKARPGHPKPGNAKRRWTHPAKAPWLLSHSPQNDRKADGPLAWADTRTDDELMREIVRPLCEQLGVKTYEVEFSRIRGELAEIAILRGGAQCWEEYPNADDPTACPLVPGPATDGYAAGTLMFQSSDPEKLRLRKLRERERESTDKFMVETQPEADDAIQVRSIEGVSP